MTTERGTGVTQADVLAAERAVRSSFDPVTGTLNLRLLRRWLARALHTDGVVSVVVVALDSARDGRFGVRDLEDRRLARALLTWSEDIGCEVFWVADGVAAVAGLTSPRVVASLHRLTRELGDGLRDRGLRVGRLIHVSGACRDAIDVLKRALGELVEEPTPPSARAEPEQPIAWCGGTVEQVFEVAGKGESLALVGSAPAGDLHPEARRLRALARCAAEPPALPLPVGARAAGTPASADELDTLTAWDATFVLAAAWRRPAVVDQVLSSLPPAVWLGVDSWVAAELPDVMALARTLRETGRKIVLTGYGTGREPLTPFDELPADALVLDPVLERGAQTSRADRALRWAIIDVARRSGLRVFSAMPDVAGRRPRPSPRADDVPPQGAIAQTIDDGWRALLTPAETALLVNGLRPERSGMARVSAYDVALAWSAMRSGVGGSCASRTPRD